MSLETLPTQTDTFGLVMNLVGASLLLLGVIFTFLAALGLFTFTDLFSRMHAASKPQMLGLLLICGGIMLTMRSWHWTLACLLVLVLQLIAAPVGSHLLGRAAYRSGVGELSELVADELAEDLAARKDQETK